MNSAKKNIFSLSFFLLFSLAVFAQERLIKGKVIDSLTRLNLTGCSIFPSKGGAGTITDSAGSFTLTVRGRSDSLVFSTVGYKTIKCFISKNVEQFITVSLEPFETSMGEVLIKRESKYTRAQWLVKQAIDRKEDNNIYENNSMQCTIYDKLELDIKNIPKIIKKNALMKPMQFVFKNADSAGKQKKIPLYLAESFSNYYYKNQFSQERYDYTAIKTSSINNNTIMDYLGNKSILSYVDKQYKKVNPYKNFINIADINFYSPIADNALKVYKFKILDTLHKDSHQYIKVGFRPFTKFAANGFDGYMWIADTVYALDSYVMHIDSAANLNFVNEFEITQVFKRDNTSKFLPERNVLYIDLVLPGKQKTGAVATKTTMFRNVLVNNSLIDTAFVKAESDTTKLTASETDWSKLRYEPLSKSEQAVFNLMDTLNKIPKVIKNVKYIVGLTTGYYTIGKIDIGNIYNTYRRNFIEGQRFNIGFRTNTSFNNEFQFNGYIGYAFKDQQVRYALSTTHVLDARQWTTLKFSLSNEITQFTTNDDVQGQLSFLSTVFNRVPLERMRLINRKDLSVQYRRFLNNGFGYGATVKNSILTPFFDVNYKDENFMPYEGSKTGEFKNYQVNEATVYLRFAYKEKFVTQQYTRSSFGSFYPFATLSFTKGIKTVGGLFEGNFDYSRWNLNIQHDFTNGRLGLLSYNINAGFTNGILPTVLLDVPPGNDSYIYNSSAFNNMNRFEFVTDRYVRLMAEQHLGRFPFRMIPFLKKLKWETLVTFNGMIGGMSEENKIANGYYDTTVKFHFHVPDRTPYLEAGVGIYKILRLIRVDAIWRLNYLNNPDVPKFGIKASLEFKL